MAEPMMNTQRMTPDETETFEERAAIMEYDGGLSRREAENLAAAFTRRSVNKKAEFVNKGSKKKQISQKTKDEIHRVKLLLNGQ